MMSFDSEELIACFGIKADGRCKNRPNYRVIALDGPGHTPNGKKVDPSVGVSLLCLNCATKVVREVVDDIEGVRETDVLTLGLMLLPIHIESTLAEQLQINVTPEMSTDPKNQKPS